MYKGTFTGNGRKNDSYIQHGPNIPGREPSFFGPVDHARMSTMGSQQFADRNKFQGHSFLPSAGPSSEPMSEFCDSELQLPMARNPPHPSPMARNMPLASSTPRSNLALSAQYVSPMTYGPYQKVQMSPRMGYEPNIMGDYFHSVSPARIPPPSTMAVAHSPQQHQVTSKAPMSMSHPRDSVRFCPYPPQQQQQSPAFVREQTFVMRSAKGSSPLPLDSNKSAIAKPAKATASAKTNKNPAATHNHRFFIGTIDQVVRWYKTAKEANLYIVYKTAGVLESIVRGGKWGEYIMVLRDFQAPEERGEEGGRGGAGSPLQLVFHPIDRGLPSNIVTGQLVSCVGRMLGENKMQLLDVESVTRESLAGIKRISFLCQWALQEAVSSVNNEP